MKFALTKSLASLMVFSGVMTTSVSFAGIGDDVDRWMRKPVVRQAAIGAAAGAAGGLLSDRVSVGRGVLAGAAAGAGSGLLRQSRYFNDKPLVRNTLQGAIIGTGAGYALGSNKLKGALIGAGAGAGYHYVRKYIDR